MRPARKKRATVAPPTPACSLFVANFQGPDGMWYFDAGAEGWRARLTRLLGSDRSLLTGV